MRTITVKEIPSERSMLEVTLNELSMITLAHKVSISENDIDDLLKVRDDNEVIGYIAGDITAIQRPDELDKDKIPDIWFVNLNYFKQHYKKIR